MGTYIKNNVAGQNTPVTITLEADIQQVDSSTVWGILPGQHYGSPQDQFLVNNTHTDGPNIIEETAVSALPTSQSTLHACRGLNAQRA
jgi:hypothetical protein